MQHLQNEVSSGTVHRNMLQTAALQGTADHWVIAAVLPGATLQSELSCKGHNKH